MAANSAPVSALPVDAELLADRGGGHRVVAGDHAHLDAGAVALLDGRLRLGPRRVDDADHGEQGEVVDVVEVQGGCGSNVAGSKSRRATTITRSPDDAIRSFSSSARRMALVVDRASTSPSGVQKEPARAMSTSGAPLTKQRMTSWPCASVIRWNVAMNL